METYISLSRNMTEETANTLKRRIHGKSFMNFQVMIFPYYSKFFARITTNYDQTDLYIREFLSILLINNNLKKYIPYLNPNSFTPVKYRPIRRNGEFNKHFSLLTNLLLIPDGCGIVDRRPIVSIVDTRR